MTVANIKFDVQLKDGTTHHIVVLNPSLVAWDRIRNINKWPDIEDGKFLWMTYISWHSMKARGLVDCTYEEFESEICVGIGDSESEETGATEETVDPTPSTPALASVSP